VTAREWLHDRAPAPPARLAARIDEVVGPRGDEDEHRVSALCLDAAEELLTELAARRSAGRESALDLLTVDALVTYAFEAAADSPESLESTATAAMIRLAATARS
jgi:hypothetical protein